MADWVRCPYNPKHVMPERRLKWHLAKTCPTALLHSSSFSTCPFNSLHLIPNHSFQQHLQTCPGHLELQSLRRCLTEQPEVCWQPSWPKGIVDLNTVYIPKVALNRQEERRNNNEMLRRVQFGGWQGR